MAICAMRGGASADAHSTPVLIANLPSAPGLPAAPQPVVPAQQSVPQADANMQANFQDAVMHLRAQNQELYSSNEALNLRMSQIQAQLESTQSESHNALKRESANDCSREHCEAREGESSCA